MGAEAERERGRDHERGRGGVAGNACSDVGAEHGRTADVHRAEAIDDAAACVLADADGGQARAEAGAEEQHARDDVGDVFPAGGDRSAEQLDEEEHHQDRQHQ